MNIEDYIKFSRKLNDSFIISRSLLFNELDKLRGMMPHDSSSKIITSMNLFSYNWSQKQIHTYDITTSDGFIRIAKDLGDTAKELYDLAYLCVCEMRKNNMYMIHLPVDHFNTLFVSYSKFERYLLRYNSNFYGNNLDVPNMSFFVDVMVMLDVYLSEQYLSQRS